MLLDIDYVIENASYRGVSFFKGKKAHVFETQLSGDPTWIIATEVKGRGIAIYSISDNAKVLVGTKKPT